MAVRIGHASISEKGTVNGNPGDSTGREVVVRTWYPNNGWSFMAIHPSEAVREKHARSIEAACANDKIGYGQGDRNTLNAEAKKKNYDLSKVGLCNCDCSSLQNVAAVASGAAGVTYGSNGWTTTTMKTALKKAGYVIVDDPKYLNDARYCVRGAIYVKTGKHTVCGLDNGQYYKTTLKAALVETPTKENAKNGYAMAMCKDEFFAGTYMTTEPNRHVRVNAGADETSVCKVVKKGTKVRCYGFYNTKGSNIWLLVEVTIDGVKYTGYMNVKYLKKV